MTPDEAGTGANAEQLRKRNRELSILNAIAEGLNREVDLGRALQTTLARVAELLGLQTGWVWLLDDGNDDSYLAAAQNLPPGLANNPELMEGSCYCLDTYRRGDLEGAANVNVVTCSRLQALVDGTDGLRYHASVPLYAAGERKLGVLNVASTDWRELSPDDLRLLYTVGDLLSIAIERARLFQRSSELGALEERNRLAREIHDTLAQGLAATALQLEAADAHLETPTDLEPGRQAVRKALALTQSSLDEARRSVLDLRAAPLEGRTLDEALAALGNDLSGDTDLEIDFAAEGHAVPLPSSVEVGLYRVAQEALTNVVRHSGATRVVMRLVSTPGEIRLSVTDDGRGFDPASVPEERYGLVGINERAALMGGRMTVESGVEVGTRIDIHIPVGPPPVVRERDEP
ncbi:MAG: GAF domain-containing sensor histidine kinase [Chloroflexi bacterium]|nr:GAF domain-containing sensor histidine kinase [Chloroflexota bacterium]